jgi:hypothetical protein
VLRLVAQYRDRYAGWAVKHFYSKYREHGKAWSRKPSGAVRIGGNASEWVRGQQHDLIVTPELHDAAIKSTPITP